MTKTKTKAPTTTIPERIELEYMMDQRRLMRDLSFMTVASLHKIEHRQDSDELLAFLRLGLPQVLNEKKLRQRLRHIAVTIGNEKVAELSLILGRQVRFPLPGTIGNWIDAQVESIQASIDHWLVEVEEEIFKARVHSLSMAQMSAAIRKRATQVSRAVESRASVAILQLNSQIIEETARGAGSLHYRWMTEDDSRVRDNHRPLHFTVQQWSDPPMGGGTKPGDKGHPGSGYGCRCLPVPIQGVPPL